MMSRIHPSTDDKGPGRVLDRTDSPSTWTVWKKSSMGFQGTDGFSIYDSNGKLAFRVDNYSRKTKGELVLMDGAGKALLTLKRQILSMRDRWNGFRGKGGLKASPRAHLFSMRRRGASIFNSGDDSAEVFMGSSMDKSHQTPDFGIEGCFWRRCCKIRDGFGQVVAEISTKRVNSVVTLSDDVFSLVIQPGFDCELIMAFVVVMDRICCRPFSPLLCHS